MHQAILLLDRHKRQRKRTKKKAKAEDKKIELSLKALAAAVGIDVHAEQGEQVTAKLRREARLYARVVASPFPGLIFSDFLRCGSVFCAFWLLFSCPAGRTHGSFASATR